MKIFFTLLLMTTATFSVFSQDSTANKTGKTQEESLKSSEEACVDVYAIVESMPEFEGGKQEFEKYLQLKSDEFIGKVYVNFVINKKGKVIQPEILRGLSPEADKIALEHIMAMPDWAPGMQRGEHVCVQYPCAVVFDNSYE